MNYIIFMVKKGKIEEIFSKARFADDPNTYKVFFRDFDIMREVTLQILLLNLIILKQYLLLELK